MPSNHQNEILIVDDIPTNIKILHDFLQQSDYKVSIAKNAESAFKKLDKIEPDLILLDIMMPGINGFEACERLKQDPKTQDIPIIFMTALADEVDKVKGLSMGAVDYITKPIHTDEVLARIKVHLKLKRTQMQLQAEVTEHQHTEKELHQTLDELQRAQVQLVHNEKMSSLGQLVAGIAHEINNPVNFIHGNLPHTERYAKDLLEIIRMYQQHVSNPPEEIEDKIEEVDLGYLEQDLLKILESMKGGTKRIREIVLSLRNFSRLHEADIKKAHIHEGIDSTLTILQGSLKRKDYPDIQVLKDYGSASLVECLPGQLNQVFMNILSNAIEALNEYDATRTMADVKEDPSIIQIITDIDNNWLTVKIIDNGAGIPEGMSSQIFNPFFTTKDVGKGTGMGLSISHKIIVEGHGGKIWCQPNPDRGTQFIVEIPMKQNTVSAGWSNNLEADQVVI